VRPGWVRTKWFDKFVGNEFERPQDGPKGEGQDARSNPPPSTIKAKQDSEVDSGLSVSDAPDYGGWIIR